LWLILALVFANGLSQINVPRLLHIASHGGTTAGTVIAKNPKDHNSVTARYAVEGVEYVVKTSFVVRPNPDKSSLAIGGPVVVFYAVDAPRVSSLGDPAALLQNEEVTIAMAAFVIPLCIVAVISDALARQRKKRGGGG
jgi:hypothetical protein